jgi:broad specificity phosphatase PhoE
MKIFAIFFMLCTLHFLATAQPPAGITAGTKIYLVRHAEKDTGNNPPLTATGFKRAGDLMRTLKSKNIQRIYSTPTRRTMQTADSLRLLQNTDTLLYKADTTGEGLFAKITAAGDAGKTILIVGHSNTVPKLIRKLGVTDYWVKDLPDNEFDNLFLITYKKKKAKLKAMKYGAASGTSAKMQ